MALRRVVTILSTADQQTVLRSVLAPKTVLRVTVQPAILATAANANYPIPISAEHMFCGMALVEELMFRQAAIAVLQAQLPSSSILMLDVKGMADSTFVRTMALPPTIHIAEGPGLRTALVMMMMITTTVSIRKQTTAVVLKTPLANRKNLILTLSCIFAKGISYFRRNQGSCEAGFLFPKISFLKFVPEYCFFKLPVVKIRP